MNLIGQSLNCLTEIRELIWPLNSPDISPSSLTVLAFFKRIVFLCSIPQNKIYIFGGEVGYSSAETPLWQLNLDSLTWYKFGSVNTNSPGISSTQPTGRSGHSAVLFENALYIYGGYQQLKGSLSELWKFDLCK